MAESTRAGQKNRAALTAQLLQHIDLIWLRGLDLNQRPLGYEPNELPGCSTPHIQSTNCPDRGQIAYYFKGLCRVTPASGTLTEIL